MPIWALNVFRAIALLLLAYLALAWASKMQAGPWGYGAILIALAAWAFFRFRAYGRARRKRKVSSWEQAIYDTTRRPRAIREARRRLARLSPEAGSLEEYLRVSLALAELLDADDHSDEAVAVALAIPLEKLAPLDAGLVLHTRAVTQLRAGDAKAALTALQGRTKTGDRELDQRLSLLAAYAHAEQGEHELALNQIASIEQDETADPSVLTEATVVRAAALDVAGRREEGLDALASVGQSALEPISALGLPRVQQMARDVLARDHAQRAEAR